MDLRDLFSTNKKKLYELFFYTFFGVIGTVVNIIIFVVLTKCFYVQYLISNLIAWIFSIVFAFVTNKIWVFKSKSWFFPLWFKEFVLFIVARVTTLIFDMGYMYVAISILYWNETVSKLIANIIIVVVNYVLSKILIFRKVGEEA